MVTVGGKAYMVCEELHLDFDLQYNPKDFKFDKPVSWKEHDDQGKAGKLEYQKNSPATIQFEAIFDTTLDGTNVRDVWVNRILQMTNAEVQPADGEVSKMAKKRPPKVEFVWGSFSMLGVIESVNVTYLMFGTDGNPVRAKVNVKMKEWGFATYEGSGQGDYYTSEKVTLVTIGAGQTLTGVASSYNQDTRTVAEANNIDDPMGSEAGDEVIVPT